MPRLLYLVTSAREMRLADGTPHETGFFAEEAAVPYRKFTEAGVDVVVRQFGRQTAHGAFGIVAIHCEPPPRERGRAESSDWLGWEALAAMARVRKPVSWFGL